MIEPLPVTEMQRHPSSKEQGSADAHTINTLTYSARKKSANFIPEYSVWKPAVSSDSASARSKGARLVSAVTAMIKITKAIQTGICPLKIHQPLLVIK
jgi:hypothetical protein